MSPCWQMQHSRELLEPAWCKCGHTACGKSCFFTGIHVGRQLVHQQIHGRKVHPACNHRAGVEDFMVSKPPAPGDHPIDCLLLVQQHTRATSRTCGFACRPGYVCMSAGLKSSYGGTLSARSPFAELAPRRSANRASSCREKKPRAWGMDPASAWHR